MRSTVVELSSIREPFKSTALTAASGSLDAIKALNKLLAGRSSDSLQPICLELAPVALVGISANWPDSPSFDLDSPAGRATTASAISLNSLGLLAMACDNEDLPSFENIIKGRYKSIFNWLIFLQKHFFQPGVDFDEYYRFEPEILAYQTSDTLSSMLGFVKDCEDIARMEVSRSPLIKSCVCELWQRFIPVDLDDAGFEQLLLRETISVLVSKLVFSDFRHGATTFIDMCHGPLVFVELLLADLEKTHQRAKASKAKASASYSCFLQSFRTALGILGGKEYYTLSSDLQLPMLVRRISAVAKWIFKDWQRRVKQRGPKFDEEVLLKIDDIVLMYCKFIFWCPATKDYLPWLDVLQSGIVKTLRFKVRPYEGMPQDDTTTEWKTRICHALTSMAIHLPAGFHFTKRLYSPSVVPSLLLWNKLNLAVQIQLKNDEIYREKGQVIDQCANCKAKAGYGPLRVCSGCHVIKYCSSTCQRLDWTNHRFACNVLQLSGSNHPFIRSNNANGLIMIAYQESAFRHRDDFSSISQKTLSKYHSNPSDDLPVFHYTTHASPKGITVKSQADFPGIFDTQAVQDPTFLSKFKELYLASNPQGGLPPYFTVISLLLNPMLDEQLDILSPLEALALCGIVGRDNWDEPPPTSVWFDLWELRYNS